MGISSTPTPTVRHEVSAADGVLPCSLPTLSHQQTSPNTEQQIRALIPITTLARHVQCSLTLFDIYANRSSWKLQRLSPEMWGCERLRLQHITSTRQQHTREPTFVICLGLFISRHVMLFRVSFLPESLACTR